ncbi:MAG: N-6 DNA methylase [Acetobacteraceae bacterium]|nr:N-6 DNA methylase [Acetobacteraceae bacterium]
MLHAPGGEDFVLRLARQIERFRLHDVQTDVLKALYENLIDPAERRLLGEYYTPDWLASKMVRAAVPRPLEQTVLDPACGSGTFLFHAIRRLLAAANAAGLARAEAVALAAERVRGIDVHPVAVIFARVTWLLALGEAVRERPARLVVPVYLGDSMQWNLREAVGGRDVVVRVPEEAPIVIPAGFAENQAAYDAGIAALQDALRVGGEEGLVAALRRHEGVTEEDARAMVAPFRRLRALYEAGRDDVWPFVLRNLVRPLWLSRPENRADVVIGNPPWVRYNELAPELQERLRPALARENLWAGQRYATSQDLAALFWVRSAERYLKEGGTIAFLLPLGFLNRPAFAGLRAGRHAAVRLAVTEAWRLDRRVQPVFPNVACALFARRDAGEKGEGRGGHRLPATVRAFLGHLPRRDATEAEADGALRVREEPWPHAVEHRALSSYAQVFRQGATIVPRRFWFVEFLPAGRLGANPGRASGAWASLAAGQEAVERRATRRRGRWRRSSFAPCCSARASSRSGFARRRPRLCRWTRPGRCWISEGAARAGFPRLAAWLGDGEGKWADKARRRADGSLQRTLRDRIDFNRGLSAQHPPAPLRVVYSKAGTFAAAAVLQGSTALVDHKAYWAAGGDPRRGPLPRRHPERRRDAATDRAVPVARPIRAAATSTSSSGRCCPSLPSTPATLCTATSPRPRAKPNASRQRYR